MNIDKKRAKKALKYTIIATLVILLVDIAGIAYLMIKWNLPFAEAMPESWMFTPKGIFVTLGGIIGFYFFVYFTETEKE